jgi:hypothetical protein
VAIKLGLVDELRMFRHPIVVAHQIRQRLPARGWSNRSYFG